MEPSEAMKAMARRICSEMATTDVDRTLFLNGAFDRVPEMRAALAAIMETQEACAKLLGNGDHLYGWEWAERIRAGAHLLTPESDNG